MIEELKLITELFKTATDNALYAFIGYGIFNLLKIAMYVVPGYKAFIFLVDRMFVGKNEDKNS